MPAAAVIPAPKAYTKVVAVKKLVVGFHAGFTVCGGGGCVFYARLLLPRTVCALQF